jgi:LPXTG-motif cell wall-anchored protein
MNTKTRRTRAQLMFGVSAVCLAFTLSMSAQVQTKTSTADDKASITTKVESGEIEYVSGNNVVVKMADGSLRHFDNVPESARITVDGKEIGVHDLKVGMKVQRTITTTTVPKTITTVQSVTGKIWQVSPPNSVILTLADGKNQRFQIPNNQKFNVNGQMTNAWGLKKGMQISATKVVEVPVTEVSQSKTVTGEMPPPPPAPPANVAILVVEQEAVAPPVQAAEATSPALPQTGSDLPLIGLLGALLIAASLGLRMSWKNR